MTKTHAFIADETGVCVDFGKAWGGNHQGVGYDGLESVLKETFEQAREMAGVSVNQMAVPRSPAALAAGERHLMEGLSNEQYHLFPFIAVDVIKAAHKSDAAAQEIRHWAGEELGWLAASVARQIEMENDEVEVIQSGSGFDAGEMIPNPMREVVHKRCPKARLIRLDGPPAIGAPILGMERANFDGYAVRDVMVRTAKEIVK